MASANDLLRLSEIVRPKAARPNLVENIDDALSNPERTLREYLFTPGIRGHFERIFRDVKEQRGGGYWVQAEYGGGKTHFLSALLCLLGEAGVSEEAVWRNVSDPEIRRDWEQVIRPRRLLRAHMSLMGTTPVVGNLQPHLVNLIDAAIVDALLRHGIADPGISASSELLVWLSQLPAGTRSDIERAFMNEHGMGIDEYRAEAGDLRAAKEVMDAASVLKLRPDVSIQVQEHARHILERVTSVGFDGIVIVIDEYFSRGKHLTPEQEVEDGSVLETIGYKLGQQDQLPFYLVLASQSPMPAKLADRFTPMVLLKDQEREYSQIVCKRIMDYAETIDEQTLLYHSHFANSFQFLRRSEAKDTREIFPFHPAVFRYLRDLVGSNRVSNAPSARFAIGVAFDAIARPKALDIHRFMTVADLLGGSLEGDILAAAEMKDAAAALRQARDFVDNSEWDLAYFHEFAHRILNHLFLDSVVRDQAQTLEQIVDGTLIEAPGGTLPPKDVAKAVLRKLQGCEQIEAKQDTWRFASRVVVGEQFDPLFQKTRKTIHKDDARIDQKWVDLLTAPPNLTSGALTFLSGVISPLRMDLDYCGLQYSARAVYASGSLAVHIEDLKRLTQPERARVVFVPKRLAVAPQITDPAIAVVAPSDIPDVAIEELRGLIACQEIALDFGARTEAGADKVREMADQKARELTRALVARQKDAYRAGEIYTKDAIALNGKVLFKDSLKAGAEGIANQLISYAYKSANTIVNAQLAKKGVFSTADAQKVFDGIFAGSTEPRTKGAAEAYGPLLGLSLPKDPAKLATNAGPGPGAVADVISRNLPSVYMDDIYVQFCNEPYGLSTGVVDLLVLACVAFNKPAALELKLQAGTSLLTRENKPFGRSIRASLLRQLNWPKDGLKGGEISLSNEVTWNEFVPIAQAVDPDSFGLTQDASQADAQQKLFIERLADLERQWDQTGKSIRELMSATGSQPPPDVQETMRRIRSFVATREGFDREAVLKFAAETWGEGNYPAIRADIKRLNGLSVLASEPRLAGRLSWFRTLAAAAPETLKDDIEMARPLLSLGYVASGDGQLHVALHKGDELHAQFLARYRVEHGQFVKWLDVQRAEIASAAARLETLERLNQIPALGPAELASARRDVERVGANLRACEYGESPDVGQGITCLSCGYDMGSLQTREPIGERARKAISEAIHHKARALSQGLIAETLHAAGDNALTGLLAAAQAGSFEQIIEKDLLSAELVARINDVLKRSKQETVPSARVYEFIANRPSLTTGNLDLWITELRNLIMTSLNDAQKANPGKEVTLLLKAADDE